MEMAIRFRFTRVLVSTVLHRARGTVSEKALQGTGTEEGREKRRGEGRREWGPRKVRHEHEMMFFQSVVPCKTLHDPMLSHLFEHEFGPRVSLRIVRDPR